MVTVRIMIRVIEKDFSVVCLYGGVGGVFIIA